MHDGWNQFYDLIAVHRGTAGLLVGALAFVECAALIGVVIPGTATMIAIGGMIGAGLLDPAAVIPAAAIGAALGGFASYRMGCLLGPKILYRWPLKRHRSVSARARLLFRQHGVPLLLVARFYAPARATVPLVAGVMNMPRSRFYVADAAAAILWVASLFTLGSMAAATLDKVAVGSAPKLMAFAAMAFATSAVSTMAVKKLFSPRPARA